MSRIPGRKKGFSVPARPSRAVFSPPRSPEEIGRALARLPGPGRAALARARAREPLLTKPRGALGRLEELAHWAAAWQGRHPARIERIAARVFAANHGIVAQGVSLYPAEVTAQMVANFARGGAAINQLCRAADAELHIEALDLDRPTADFTQAPAMTEAEFAAAFARGCRAVPDRADLLCLGEMGIGNTTAAAAVCHALFGGRAEAWVGPGTGVTGRALRHKARVVGRGAARHRQAVSANPLEALRCLGGREMAAIAGAVLAARFRRIPVLLDGYVCTAAACALEAASPGALDHCRAGHVSAEPGHRRLLAKLGMRPLLDLDMRLGEGTGAVLAAALVRAACAAHAGMATFAEARVTRLRRGSGGLARRSAARREGGRRKGGRKR